MGLWSSLRRLKNPIQTWAIDPAHYADAVASREPRNRAPKDGVSVDGNRVYLSGYIYPDVLDSLRDGLAQAAEGNPNRIYLEIDSPGGLSDGVASMAEEIEDSRIPIDVQVYGQCCSAAYWLASRAHSISAAKDATIGSIGVFSVAVDSSRAAAEQGVDVHVFRSHELKGIGVPGAPITEAQRAELQRRTDDVMSLFGSDVMRGRDIDESAMPDIATGQTWSGVDAEKKGLIDWLIYRKGANMAEIPVVPPDTQTVAPAASADVSAIVAERDNALAFARELIVDRGIRSGRIMPASSDLYTRLGATYGSDLRGFAAAIEALPQHGAVHPVPIGASATAQVEDADPMDTIRRMAKDIVADEAKRGVRLSDNEAINRVCAANPDLYILVRGVR